MLRHKDTKNIDYLVTYAEIMAKEIKFNVKLVVDGKVTVFPVIFAPYFYRECKTESRFHTKMTS